jgi:hypothetical protein
MRSAHLVGYGARKFHQRSCYLIEVASFNQIVTYDDKLHVYWNPPEDFSSGEVWGHTTKSALLALRSSTTSQNQQTKLRHKTGKLTQLSSHGYCVTARPDFLTSNHHSMQDNHLGDETHQSKSSKTIYYIFFS